MEKKGGLYIPHSGYLFFSERILIANIIAWPFAWYFVNKWLQNFACQVNISILIFLVTGVFALVMALLTVSYQAQKLLKQIPQML